MATLKLANVVNFESLAISKVFFDQLKKVGTEKETALAKWRKDYKGTENEEEKAAKWNNATALQIAYYNYKEAQETLTLAKASECNNEECSVPTEDGTNDVVKGWNKDVNGNEYKTAKDVIKAYIKLVSDTINVPNFTYEYLCAIGAPIDGAVYLSSDNIIKHVETLYEFFTKKENSHKADKEAAQTVIKAVENALSVMLRFTPKNKQEETKKEMISTYISDYELSDYAANLVRKHFAETK